MAKRDNGWIPNEEEVQWLARMPWRKLILSNGIAGVIGGVILAFYANQIVFPKIDAIDQKIDKLMLRLIVTPKSTETALASPERSVKVQKQTSGASLFPSAHADPGNP